MKAQEHTVTTTTETYTLEMSKKEAWAIRKLRGCMSTDEVRAILGNTSLCFDEKTEVDDLTARIYDALKGFDL